MTTDEYLVYRFTRGSLPETIDYLANGDVHPPLWFSFFWFWQRLAGQSDFVGRMQAILFTMMTLCVVYQLGRRWFGAPRFGLFAVIVLGVSALFFHYSLEIRPYALAMLLTSLSMLAFARWLSLKTWRAAAWYALSIAALLYVHYFLFLFILTQVIYFLLQRPSRQLFMQAVGVGLLAFVLWLPWFPSFLTQFEHIRTVELASGASRAVAGSSATTQPTSIESILNLIQLASNGQPILYAVVMLIGVAYGWRKCNYRLALAWALGVPLVAFVLNTLVAVYTPRYIVNFVIGLALVLAAGLALLPSRFRWGVLTVFAVFSLWGLPSQLPRNIVPYRLLYQDLVQLAKPGDVVYFDQHGYTDDVTKWVWRNNVPEWLRKDATTELEEALKARRIWHVNGDWLNPEVQANFRAIEATHPLQSVFGQCDVDWCYLMQLMEAPPWNDPKVFGEYMAFWGADVDSVTPNMINTRLWWKVEHAPSLDYSIGLHLLDTNGATIAQVDGPITHYGQQVVNTSQLEPGRIYIDLRTLDLPPTLSPENYRLQMVVYDWQTGSRLRLPDGSDSLLLDQINLPPAQARSLSTT